MKLDNERSKSNSRAFGNIAYIKDKNVTHHGYDVIELALLMHAKGRGDRDKFTEDKFNWGEGG